MIGWLIPLLCCAGNMLMGIFIGMRIAQSEVFPKIARLRMAVDKFPDGLGPKEVVDNISGVYDLFDAAEDMVKK